MLKNDMCITEIGQAVLELGNCDFLPPGGVVVESGGIT